MPDDRLKVGDRVRMKPDAPSRDLMPGSTSGVVIQTGTENGIDLLSIELDGEDEGFAMGTAAAEWERDVT